MIVSGQGNVVREYMAWAVLVIDSCVELCTSKFLPWRMTLYATLVQTHVSSGDWETAGRVALQAKGEYIKQIDTYRLETEIDTYLETDIRNIY